MEQRTAGRSGLKMSALSLGTMTFASGSSFGDICATDHEATEIIAMALDAGIDTFDTANAYGAGASEDLLGRSLRGRRQRVNVVTKCRFPTQKTEGQIGPNDFGLSRSSIISACDASLRRLATDYIDVFILHMQDRLVPLEETMSAMNELVRAGKVRYVGCSNFTGYRLTEALWASDKRCLVPPCVVQLPWSLVQRDAERELMPAAKAFGLGVMVYSPLARGFLSGKYTAGEAAPSGSRLSVWGDVLQEYDTPGCWSVMRTLRQAATELHEPIGAVALAFVLSRPTVTTVVLGARSVAQFRENLRAATLRLPRSIVDELTKASTPPSWGYPYDFIGRFEPW